MTNANQLALLLIVFVAVCGFSYGYPEVLAPINEIAHALGAAKP